MTQKLTPTTLMSSFLAKVSYIHYPDENAILWISLWRCYISFIVTLLHFSVASHLTKTQKWSFIPVKYAIFHLGNYGVFDHQVAPHNNLVVSTVFSYKSVILKSSVKPSQGCRYDSLAWFGRRFKNHWLRIAKVKMELLFQNYCFCPLL